MQRNVKIEGNLTEEALVITKLLITSSVSFLRAFSRRVFIPGEEFLTRDF